MKMVLRIFAIAVGVPFIALSAGAPGAAHANPASIWVINQNVADALHGSTVDFSTAGGRAAVISELDAFAAASEGQAGVTAAAVGFAGAPVILVKTDGSTDQLTLNGRGLTCSPACDAITSVFPDATDYFVVFTVLDGGTHSPGDTLVVTATQDAVTLDSATVTVVGQAHDMTLTMASGKTTVTAGAPSCAIGDSPSDPTRALGRASFTDINGTPLVGYHPTFTTSASSVMHVGNVSGSGAASWEVTSMLQADGQTAGEDVVCGVSAGPATLSAVTRSDEIQGVSGTVTRTQVITVNSPPSVGGIAEAPVIGDVAEPHHGAGPAWWIALAVIGVAGAGGAWLWRRRLSR